jgi:hypothetical protein
LGPGCWVFVDPLATYGDHGHTRRGSFGLLVEDLIPKAGDADRRLVLTAAHLFRDVQEGATVSCSPPGPEPSSIGGQHFGEVRRRVPLVYLPSIDVDAAVIKPRPEVECSNLMGSGTPTGIRDLLLKSERDSVIQVRKHGASTGETTGDLLSILADHYVEDVEARYSTGWWAYSRKDEPPFAAKGDSGSIVLDEERKVVGMVVAIKREDEDTGGDGFVHAIKPILSALKVRLPQGD